MVVVVVVVVVKVATIITTAAVCFGRVQIWPKRRPCLLARECRLLPARRLVSSSCLGIGAQPNIGGSVSTMQNASTGRFGCVISLAN